jgi:hypothetical protein
MLKAINQNKISNRCAAFDNMNANVYIDKASVRRNITSAKESVFLDPKYTAD